jgi:hypothetical protein
VKVFIVEKSRKKRVYQPCYDTAVQHDGGNPSGEFADLRSDYTLTMTDDQGKTPFQRLLEQPFEDKLEEKRVKMAALALKGVTDVVEQKVKMDQAVDSLLSWAKHIGLY